MLDEPFIAKHLPSVQLQSSLAKLSEALGELSLVEKNLDEKVLGYLLSNLRPE